MLAGDTPALAAALGLVELLRRYYDDIEADFQRFYGLDLGAVCWGPTHVGARRLRALVFRLPPESSLARRLGWSWSDLHEMTATLVELAHHTAVASHALVQIGSGKRWKGPDEPLRFPRPEPPAELRQPERPKGLGDIRRLMFGALDERR